MLQSKKKIYVCTFYGKFLSELKKTLYLAIEMCITVKYSVYKAKRSCKKELF